MYYLSVSIPNCYLTRLLVSMVISDLSAPFRCYKAFFFLISESLEFEDDDEDSPLNIS